MNRFPKESENREIRIEEVIKNLIQIQNYFLEQEHISRMKGPPNAHIELKIGSCQSTQGKILKQ